jgi:hypothetical protein
MIKSEEIPMRVSNSLRSVKFKPFLAGAALAGSLLFGTAAGAGTVLPQLDPLIVDITASGISAQASIEFINHLSYSVDLFWIDYTGVRELYATIPGNSSFFQETYLTHPWLIVQTGTETLIAGLPSPTGFIGVTGNGTMITGFIAQTADPGWLNLETSPDIANIGTATPLPAALPLFATGLGVMGWLAKRRKRNTAALAA